MTALLSALVETQAPSVAGIITACGTVLTALGAILIGYWQFRINSQQKVTDKKVETVHTIVNQRFTDQQRYNIALAELLKKNGIEIPVDQSLPVTGQPDAQPGQPQ